ncbi:MAG TPA: cation-transporting P-type ATPase [Syntrophorhabdaceae bacterium]|nr:cation-transporting P-type ATPase [Syntrophorhabdaceae bacterium]
MKDTKWHAEETTTVLNELKTDRHTGLMKEDVEERLAQYGYNELRKEKKVSALGIFLSQFKNALIIILLVATVLSFAVGEAFDSIFILIIVIFCAILGFIQEYRPTGA